VNERSKARVVTGGGVGGFGSRNEQVRERMLNRLQSLVGNHVRVALS
jgi:hypothetical protein